MRNIYLIGMMGSGKSCVGEELARELALEFADLDGEIEKTANMTVNEIFERHGEGYFRRVEKAVLKAHASWPGQVIATGGGIVCDPENVGLMKRTGLVIYLETPLEILWDRVQHKTDRPLLKVPDPQGLLTRLFRERRLAYETACDWTVGTAHKEASQVMREITMRWKERG